MSSRKWWKLAGGGCATLVLVGVLLGVFVYPWAIKTLANKYAHGGFSCMPSDLPKYPGATTISESYDLNGGSVPPQDTTQCQETLGSPDSPAKVVDFYTTRLEQGDWKITATAKSGSEIDFQRRSRAPTMGVLTISEAGKQTQVDVTLDF